MLQINAMSNYNNQINFNGKFKKTYALSKAMEKANKYDLKKFDELLERMSKTDDKRLFELYSIVESNYGRMFHIVNFRESQLGYKTNFLESTKISNISDKGYEAVVYNDVLAKINGILEGIYRDKEAENIDKKTLIENICKKLS